MINAGEIITTENKKYYCFDSILENETIYLFLCSLEEPTNIFFATQINDGIKLLSKKSDKLHALELFNQKALKSLNSEKS